nr:hypothetical protein GCM10020185_13540 [Pseudomonas brassicacearum subsp. brassicacearum]
MHRQQLRTGRATTAVELDRVQAQHVHAETDHALGEAGLGVEDETLGPFLGFALGIVRVGEVAVDVEVAQIEVDLGILDKPRLRGQDGQGGAGQGDGDEAGEKGAVWASWALSLFFYGRSELLPHV